MLVILLPFDKKLQINSQITQTHKLSTNSIKAPKIKTRCCYGANKLI